MENKLLNPRDLYEPEIKVSDALRERGESGSAGPVLIVALKGAVDAGHLTEIISQHLLNREDSKRVVTFDHDRLIDYQAKRPMLTFDTARWVDYARPEIGLELLTDAEGTEFLLLHGQEPDRYWEGFVSAVVDIINDYNVSLVVSVAGIPMGVPHTRPNGAILHATRDGLIDEDRAWAGTMQVPATVANLIQFTLAQFERDAIGIAVHVPHYLAQSQYTPAAISGLAKVEALTGLDLATSGLSAAADEALSEIERQAGKSQEISEMITALENQYDAFMAAHPDESLLAHVTRIPTAEELGAKFEEFLSEYDGNPDFDQTS